MGSLSFLPGRLVLVEANSLQNSQYLGKQPEQGCAILRYCGPSGQDNGWGQTTFLVLALFPKLLDIRNESKQKYIDDISVYHKSYDTSFKKNGVKNLELLCPQIHSLFLVLVIYRHLLLKKFQLIFYEAKWPAVEHYSPPKKIRSHQGSCIKIGYLRTQEISPKGLN